MNNENDNLILRFLYSEMAEQERDEFEERFIADSGLFEQIKAVEDDLIEKYVRGWMPQNERLKFETKFLTTEKRRERVAFSLALIERVVAEDESEAVEMTDDRPTFFDGVRSWFFTPQVAVFGVIGLLVAVVGGWLIVQNAGRREIVKQVDSGQIEAEETNEMPEMIVTPEASPEPVETPANQNVDNTVNTQKPTPVEKPKQTPVPAKTPKIQTAPRSTVLALFPGRLRSNGEANILDLTAKPASAAFQLNLQSVDYKIYSAQITNADGVVVVQFNGLRPSNNVLKFSVGANKLEKGDYLIKLSGKNKTGENESVSDFQFRVKQ